MSWQEIVRQLHALHEARNRTPLGSIYEGQYVDEAKFLNKKLKKIIGKDYSELTPALIANCLSV